MFSLLKMVTAFQQYNAAFKQFVQHLKTAGPKYRIFKLR